MTVLVTGARGNVGRHVLTGLLDARIPVRASSRDPRAVRLPAAVEVVAADLTRPDTLPAALDGVHKVFLYAEPEGVDGFVTAARAAGVQHVVLLSSASAAFPPERQDNPITQRHVIPERALRESGIPWTFVRPGAFATNSIMLWGDMIRKEGVVRSAYPQAHTDPIHEKDIAAVALAALTGSGHEGQAYLLGGPESLTQRRQVELIGAALGRQLRFEELTPDQAREQMGKLLPPFIVEMFLKYQSEQDGTPVPVHGDTVRQVTGRPAHTFAQWAADHVDDFR